MSVCILVSLTFLLALSVSFQLGLPLLALAGFFFLIPKMANRTFTHFRFGLISAMSLVNLTLAQASCGAMLFWGW
jgi:hypothetical protein